MSKQMSQGNKTKSASKNLKCTIDNDKLRLSDKFTDSFS